MQHHLDTPDQLPPDVRSFLDHIESWTPTRWLTALESAMRSSLTEQRALSAALRDAILAVEHLRLTAWFVEDAATDAVQSLRETPRADMHERARQLAADAALALLARPALPSRDLAVLLAPFLPLLLPTTAPLRLR